MNISIGSDHGGLTLKTQICDYLELRGHNVIDCGTDSSDSCDYPDFALQVAHNIVSCKSQIGIVVCTTGVGIAIASNKVKGIRCCQCLNADMASMSRKHNNCNMISLGAKYTAIDQAKEMLEAFINSTFEGGRHQKRLDKITAMESIGE